MTTAFLIKTCQKVSIPLRNLTFFIIKLNSNKMMSITVMSILILSSTLVVFDPLPKANATTVVGVDATNLGTFVSGTISSASSTITVGNNTNRALVAIFYSDNAVTVNSVTGAANSFNKIYENTNQGLTTSIWISLNPNTGSNTITANFNSQTTQAELGVYSLYNVNQTTGYVSSNTQSNSGTTNPSTNITPTSTNNLILDGVATGGTLSTPSQTQAWLTNPSGASHFGSQYKANLSNLNTLTYSWTQTGSVWNQVVVEVLASSGGGGFSSNIMNMTMTQWESLNGITLEPGQFLDVAATSPFKITAGNATMYVPCDGSGNANVVVYQGKVNATSGTFAPITPVYISRLSTPNQNCWYNFGVGTSNGVTDFALNNTSGHTVTFNDRNTVIFTFAQALKH